MSVPSDHQTVGVTANGPARLEALELIGVLAGVESMHEYDLADLQAAGLVVDRGFSIWVLLPEREFMIPLGVLPVNQVSSSVISPAWVRDL